MENLTDKKSFRTKIHAYARAREDSFLLGTEETPDDFLLGTVKTP